MALKKMHREADARGEVLRTLKYNADHSQYERRIPAYARISTG